MTPRPMGPPGRWALDNEGLALFLADALAPSVSRPVEPRAGLPFQAHKPPLDALNGSYDHSGYCARSDEYRRVMTGSPTARLVGKPVKASFAKVAVMDATAYLPPHRDEATCDVSITVTLAAGWI